MPRAASCAACGASVRPGQPYCDACGVPLVSQSSEAVLAPAGVPPIALHTQPVAAVAARAVPSPGDRWDIGYVGASLAFATAVFVRFYRLGDIPGTVHSAEDAFRRAAASVQEYSWIALWSDATGGQPTGFAYLMGIWGRLLGDSGSSYRLLAAAIGVATIAVFYIFSRSVVGRRAAVFGSLLMAFSAWHLGYSRLALPVISLLLLELVAAHLLLLALREEHLPARRKRLLVLAGLSFGAGAYLHGAFFIFAAGVVLLWLRELLAGEQPVRAVLRTSMAFFVPALAVATPYLVSSALNSGEVADHVRASAVSRSPAYRTAEGVTEQTRYVLGNIGRTAAAVLWRSSREDEAESRRLLDPATGVLATLGLVVGLGRWRERGHFFLLSLVAVAVVGAGLTVEQGMYGRLIVAAPAIFAYAGFALHWLLTWTKGRVREMPTYAVVALLLAFVVAYNLRSYYAQPFGPGETLWAHSGQALAQKQETH